MEGGPGAFERAGAQPTTGMRRSLGRLRVLILPEGAGRDPPRATPRDAAIRSTAYGFRNVGSASSACVPGGGQRVPSPLTGRITRNKYKRHDATIAASGQPGRWSDGGSRGWKKRHWLALNQLLGWTPPPPLRRVGVPSASRRTLTPSPDPAPALASPRGRVVGRANDHDHGPGCRRSDVRAPTGGEGRWPQSRRPRRPGRAVGRGLRGGIEGRKAFLTHWNKAGVNGGTKRAFWRCSLTLAA